MSLPAEQITVKTLVRCNDRTVFEIDPITLDAKSCGFYDAYCYTDPCPDAVYISQSEWTRLRNCQWDQQMQQFYSGRKPNSH